MSNTRISTAGAVATCLLLAAAAPSAAFAKPATPGTEQSITVCHATNSDTNPYVQETISVSSIGELPHGHGAHTGPVWSPALKDAKVSWGDIVPAYTAGSFSFAGANLSPEGLAIWLAGCSVAGEQAGEAQPSGDVATDAPADDESPSGDPHGEVLPIEESATDETPTDETPTDTIDPTEAPGETPDPNDPGDGEIVIDGPFVTPAPSSTPVGEVLGATGAPDMTPPPTDTGARTAPGPGAGFQMLLVAVTGLSLLVLLLGRVPAARRS